MALGCRQCLPLSVVHLKGKHYRKPHCRVHSQGLTFQDLSPLLLSVETVKVAEGLLSAVSIKTRKEIVDCFTS